jgi:hypothetical protein
MKLVILLPPSLRFPGGPSFLGGFERPTRATNLFFTAQHHHGIKVFQVDNLPQAVQTKLGRVDWFSRSWL